MASRSAIPTFLSAFLLALFFAFFRFFSGNCYCGPLPLSPVCLCPILPAQKLCGARRLRVNFHIHYLAIVKQGGRGAVLLLWSLSFCTGRRVGSRRWEKIRWQEGEVALEGCLANASVCKCSLKIPLGDVRFVLDCAHSEFFPSFFFSYIFCLIQGSGGHGQYGHPGVGPPSLLGCLGLC